MSSSANPPPVTFDEALALSAVGDDHFEATIAPGWDIRGTPHGGYLLALLAKAACQVAPQPDPISIAANYLAPPSFGRAELGVEIVRAGRRQTTVAVRLIQDGLECVRATVTAGTLDTAPAIRWGDDTAAPAIPSPEACIPTADLNLAIGEDDIGLHHRLDLVMHPDTGWIVDKPSGVPQLDGWLRLKSESETTADPLALLLFTDGFPPSMFEATGPSGGHVPTVQLTTHLFAKPTPGWIQARFRTRVRGGGFLDEDGELWDSAGQLVATTRQLALIR